jgi:hypothetical protein
MAALTHGLFATLRGHDHATPSTAAARLKLVQSFTKR